MPLVSSLLTSRLFSRPIPHIFQRAMLATGKTHLALLQEEAKGPLVVKRVPTISPESHQVQVRVKAAGLNVWTSHATQMSLC